tara:strand:- start:539 stop:982 length:444 start_codon:yes stop_codon:yes gene_type:complete
MEYLVVLIAVLVLAGSISIAIPSKASRKISKLRMEAKLLGCKILSTLYGENKFKNNNSNPVIYQIKNLTRIKEAHFIRDNDQLILYSPVKLKFSDNFELINKKLNGVSNSIEEIIFSNASISFLWKEVEGLEELKIILIKLGKLKNL